MKELTLFFHEQLKVDKWDSPVHHTMVSLFGLSQPCGNQSWEKKPQEMRCSENKHVTNAFSIYIPISVLAYILISFIICGGGDFCL